MLSICRILVAFYRKKTRRERYLPPSEAAIDFTAESYYNVQSVLEKIKTASPIIFKDFNGMVGQCKGLKHYLL